MVLISMNAGGGVIFILMVRILFVYFLLQNCQVWITIEDFQENCSIIIKADTAGVFEVRIEFVFELKVLLLGL